MDCTWTGSAECVLANAVEQHHVAGSDSAVAAVGSVNYPSFAVTAAAMAGP